MSKTKDMVLVDLYNAEEVRMVLEHLRKKTRRVADRERKKACAEKHTLDLILKAYRKGA